MLDQDLTGRQDPCLTQPPSIVRIVVLVLLFLTMFSSVILLLLMKDRPYGVQLSSIVGYTAAVAFYTFSRNRNNNQPFLLSCPAVRGQLPHLVRRHLGFLAILFMFQTAALALRPNLTAYWRGLGSGDPSTFAVVLSVLCICLALVQTITNRSLLERAHLSTQTKAAI